MLLYQLNVLKGEGAGVSIYNSSDLLKWEYQSHLEGIGESPDLFEIPYDGKSFSKKWVLLSGEGDYVVGAFDGKAFQPETSNRKLDNGKNFFASQSISNPADGTIVQLSWMRGGEFPDMPFNGQLTFPVELRLISSKNGPVISRKPIASISKLYDRELQKKDKNIIPGLKGNLAGGLKGKTFHIRAILHPKSSDSFGFVIRSGKQSNGTEVRYETAKKILDVNGSRMPLETINGKIDLEILIDRSSIEVFCNNGTSGISSCFTPAEGNEDLGLYTQGGELFVESLDIRTIKSVWLKSE
jgi:sucrose-6-phosphate hydrolase SacC (GH32 family)